jgi:hypothetical protein
MITHIKGSKVTPYTQRMYKVGYGPNTFGYTSEDKLHTITPPIQGAVEYSHTRTIYYLNEDPFSQSPKVPTTTLEELELPYE